MRNSSVVFIAIAFAVYWLIAGDTTEDKSLTLGPVKPSLVRIPNPPYDLEEPVHTDSVSLKSDAMHLSHWLRKEASRIGQVDADPQQTQLRLRFKAAQLSRSDFAFLKRSALDRSLTMDERFLAVYMLGLAGGAAMDSLRELSFARIPGLPNDRQHSEEVILRTQAIEALVQKLPSGESRALLRELLSRTSDPIIARHVQYWLNRLG